MSRPVTPEARAQRHVAAQQSFWLTLARSVGRLRKRADQLGDQLPDESGCVRYSGEVDAYLKEAEATARRIVEKLGEGAA